MESGEVKPFQHVLRFATPYRARISRAILLSAAAVGVGLLLPLGMREIIDIATEGGDRGRLSIVAATLLILYFVRAVLSYSGRVLLQITGEQITADVRKAAYEKLHSLSLSYFTHQRTGEILSRLSSDATSIRTVAVDVPSSLIVNCLMSVGSIVVIVSLNWRLSILVLCMSPAVVALSRVYGPRVQKQSAELRGVLADATGVAQEALAGIRVVQAFGRGHYEVMRFAAQLDDYVQAARRVIGTSTVIQITGELLFMICIVGILWYGGMEVISGRLSAGDFIAFVFYAQNIALGATQALESYATVRRAAGTGQGIFQLFETQSDLSTPVAPVVLRDMRGKLDLRDVVLEYAPGCRALDRVSLSISAGETLAIVGPSGAGKTTLLNLLMRMYDPTEGVVELDDHDLRRLDIAQVRSKFAIVSQDAYLFRGSIAENIRYGRMSATEGEIEDAARAANADDFVRTLPDGYATMIGENGVRLSSGQRQRIAIARALLRKPRVLLLDEATSALDSLAEVRVGEAIGRLRHGQTTIVVTHRLEAIRSIPRIVLMEGGSILAEGTHAELMASPGLYRDLVQREEMDGRIGRNTLDKPLVSIAQ